MLLVYYATLYPGRFSDCQTADLRLMDALDCYVVSDGVVGIYCGYSAGCWFNLISRLFLCRKHRPISANCFAAVSGHNAFSDCFPAVWHF